MYTAWLLSWIAPDTGDFAPIDDAIQHSPGEGCVCGPARIEPTELQPELIFRHYRLDRKGV